MPALTARLSALLRSPRLSATKSTVARLATTPLVGRAVARVFGDRIPSAVGPVDTHDPVVPDQVKARLALRLYERAELRFVDEHLPRDLDVVELGASIGVVTRAVAGHLDPGRKVVAVEADPRLIAPLRANLDLGGVADRVHVVHAAVGSPAGAAVELVRGRLSTDARIATEVTAPTGTTRPHPDLDQDLDRERDLVPTCSLATVLADAGIDGPYSLVVDIEGAEARLARDDAEALARCRVAVVEVHDTVLDGEALAWPEVANRVAEGGGFRTLAAHGPVLVFGR
jgi:FkbM family methyltransferase